MYYASVNIPVLKPMFILIMYMYITKLVLMYPIFSQVCLCTVLLFCVNIVYYSENMFLPRDAL